MRPHPPSRPLAKQNEPKLGVLLNNRQAARNMCLVQLSLFPLRRGIAWLVPCALTSAWPRGGAPGWRWAGCTCHQNPGTFARLRPTPHEHTHTQASAGITIVKNNQDIEPRCQTQAGKRNIAMHKPTDLAAAGEHADGGAGHAVPVHEHQRRERAATHAALCLSCGVAAGRERPHLGFDGEQHLREATHPRQVHKCLGEMQLNALS